jgi:hypothetical protein
MLDAVAMTSDPFTASADVIDVCSRVEETSSG